MIRISGFGDLVIRRLGIKKDKTSPIPQSPDIQIPIPRLPNNPSNRKGITLIEMAAVIVVLGLSIPVLMTMWADVAWRSGRSEALADAAFYAQSLMEEIKAKRFDERLTSPWSSSLGPNTTTTGLDGVANETLTGMSNWDDADDFNGYLDTPASGYRRSATVNYIGLNAAGTWYNCPPLPGSGCSAVSNCACGQCCYKRIQVRVWRLDNLTSGVTLVTIASGY